jgi:hypothetical protein
MEDERPLRGGQRFGFGVRDGTTHQGRGDVSYLVAIDEAVTVFGGYDDPVKDVQLGHLQDMFDRAESGPA